MEKNFIASVYDSDNQCVRDLLELVDKYHYSLEGENEEILVFAYLAGLVSSENYEAYIENSIEDYEEILAIIEHDCIDEYLIAQFENIFNYASSDIECNQLIVDFLDLYFSQMRHADTVLKHTHLDVRENKTYVEQVISSIRSEAFEENKVKYAAVLNFIKQQYKPVSKKYIKDNLGKIEYKFIRKILNSEEKIVKLHGEYIWYDNLNLSMNDEKLLAKVVCDIVQDEEVHHVREVYDVLRSNYEYIINKINLKSARQLLGVLAAMPGARDYYNISLPYIAKPTIEITTGKERLSETIRDKEFVNISDLIEKAKENYIKIGTISDFLDYFKETHILLDKYTLVNVSYLDLKGEDIVQIKSILFKEASQNNGLMAIVQLKNVDDLPKIKYEWNEWLIYSILKRHFDDDTVFLSSGTFSQAIPMYASKTDYDVESVKNLEKRYKYESLNKSRDTDLESTSDTILDFFFL